MTANNAKSSRHAQLKVNLESFVPVMLLPNVVLFAFTHTHYRPSALCCKRKLQNNPTVWDYVAKTTAGTWLSPPSRYAGCGTPVRTGFAIAA
jgi:hypothetical protein